MRNEGQAFIDLAVRYGSIAHNLHGAYFYDGDCEPEKAVIADIRATADYIRGAEGLASN